MYEVERDPISERSGGGRRKSKQHAATFPDKRLDITESRYEEGRHKLVNDDQGVI